MKILSVGGFNGLSNTCLHRHWALKEMANEIEEVNSRPAKLNLWYKIVFKLFQLGFPLRLPDPIGTNKKIKKLIKESIEKPYDIIWIDKGLTINSSTLEYIKKYSSTSKIVSYTADNMALRHNQSQNFLNSVSLYDVHFTTKSYIIDDLKKIGAKKVIFTNKHYESSFHYPRDLSEKEINKLGGDVGFIGAWEKERCESILYLASNGINVKVYGGGKWNEYKGLDNLTIEPGVFSENYPKSLQSFKLSLCFLRKMNLDQQTSRTMEIPACGGFMLAERTDEHLFLFKEGIEAEYFSNDEELLEKCKYYLTHTEQRLEISKAGTQRCISSGYSNKDSVKRMVNQVLNG